MKYFFVSGVVHILFGVAHVVFALFQIFSEFGRLALFTAGWLGGAGFGVLGVFFRHFRPHRRKHYLTGTNIHYNGWLAFGPA